MVKKIALGTVQFGIKYGLNNEVGKTSTVEVRKILNYARKTGIKVLDTASLYGESEEVLGKENTDSFSIVSKLPPCQEDDVNDMFESSLKKLQKNSIYGYLFHNFQHYLANPLVLEQLKTLQEKQKIKKLGFSLYKPEELEILWKRNISFQLIQVPYNIFDQRFGKHFLELKEKGVEIHTRSAFLQGLFFRDTDKLPSHFNFVRNKLEVLNRICLDLQVEKNILCLGFPLLNPHIDKVVIGVDNLQHLKANIQGLQFLKKIRKAYSKLENMQETDENIILPVNWKVP